MQDRCCLKVFKRFFYFCILVCCLSSGFVAPANGFYQRMVTSDEVIFQSVIPQDPRLKVFFGHIIDYESHDPVPGITLVIYDAAGEVIASDISDSDGYYSIALEQEGSYYAVIEASANYLGKVVGGEWCVPDGKCDPLTGVASEMVFNEYNYLEFNGQLYDGGVINGVVSSADDESTLEGMRISVYDSEGVYVASTTTNRDGAYSVVVPETGQYFLKANKSTEYFGKVYGGDDCLAGCELNKGALVETEYRKSVYGVDFSLQKGASISGVLKDAINDSVLTESFFWSRYTIEVYSDSGRRLGVRHSDSDGHYRYGPLLEGKYFVKVIPDTSTGYLVQTYGCEDECALTEDIAISLGDKASLDGIDFSLRKGGSISGIVRLAGGEEVAQYSRVSLYSDSFKYPRSVSASSTGSYSFKALPVGDYYLKADSYQDYIGVSYGNTPCVGFECDPTQGEAVSVSLGELTDSIDFSLPPGGSIRGVVTFEDGSGGVPGISVSAYSLQNEFSISAITEDDGSYSIRALPAGDYYLRAIGDGVVSETYGGDVCLTELACEWSQSTIVSVVDENPVSDIDFSLGRTASISGTITLTDSEANVHNALVRLYSKDGQHLKSVYTDEEGNYQFENVFGGGYYVLIDFYQDYSGTVYGGKDCRFFIQCDFTTGTLVTASLGEQTNDIDFSLTPGARIKGTLLDESTGSVVERAKITLYDSGKRVLSSTYSGPLGVYEFFGLPEGKYFVEVSGEVKIEQPPVEPICESTFFGSAISFCSYPIVPDEFREVYRPQLFDNESCSSVWDCDVTQSKPIAVETGKTIDDVDFQMEKLGAIEGVVMAQDTGELLEGAFLVVLDESYQEKAWGSANADGEFYIGGLDDGTYFLTAFNHGEYIGYMYGGSNEHAPVYAFEIKNGELVSGISLQMQRGMTISGKLVDSVSGEVIQKAYLCLHGGYACALVDGLGQYSFTGVPPGEHQIWFDFAEGHIVPRSLIDVSVELGVDVTDFDFLLPKGGAISGTVRSNETGEIISQAWIGVFDSDGNWIQVFGEGVDDNGQYQISGIPTGEYFIDVYAYDDVHAGAVYGGPQCFFRCPVTSGTAVSVIEGQTTAGIDFNLEEGGYISGVIDAVPNKEPFPYFQLSVRVFNTEGEVVGRTTPNQTGEFRVHGMESGDYYVAVSSNKEIFHSVWGGGECPSGYLELNSSCVTSKGRFVSVKQGEESSGVLFRFYDVAEPEADEPPLRSDPIETEAGGGGGATGWPELLLWLVLMSGWFRLSYRHV